MWAPLDILGWRCSFSISLVSCSVPSCTPGRNQEASPVTRGKYGVGCRLCLDAPYPLYRCGNRPGELSGGVGGLDLQPSSLSCSPSDAEGHSIWAAHVHCCSTGRKHLKPSNWDCRAMNFNNLLRAAWSFGVFSFSWRLSICGSESKIIV